MEDIISLEKQRARAVAEDYRSRSFEVIEEPSPDQLPDFLSAYRPDLLIRKGDVAIVVEVKTRASLAADPQVRDLAQLLQKHPGWSFELVVVGEQEKLDTPETARPFDRVDIQKSMQTAGELLDSGFAEAGFVLAWSGLEATVRLLTEEEGISLDRFTPLYILKQAVTNGVISRDDYNLLMSALKYRNAVVHGFKVTSFDSDIARDLIVTSERLLRSA